MRNHSTLFNKFRHLAFILLLLLVSCAPLEHTFQVVRIQFLSPSQRYLQEGDRLSAMNRTAEAIMAYRRAVDLDTKNVPAQIKLSSGYAKQGRKRLARRFLLDAQMLQPENLTVQQALDALQSPSSASAALQLQRIISVGQAEPTGMDVIGETVFITLVDGQVSAYQLDGNLLWQVNLPAAITSAPILAGHVLLVGAQDGCVYAVSTQDGSTQWRSPTKGPLYAAPLVVGSRAYIASSDGSLYVFNLTDGKLQWSFAAQGALHASPALANGVLYFGSADTHLYALMADTGQPFWPHGIPTQGMIETQPVITEGRLFFGSGDGRLYALDAASGGEYWRYSTPDGIFASPVLAGGTLYLASSGQLLAAFDPLNNQPKWEFNSPTPLRQPPLVMGNNVYFVGESDPNLYALNRQDGSLLWQLDTGDWLSSPPIQSGNHLLLAGKDGSILVYFNP